MDEKRRNGPYIYTEGYILVSDWSPRLLSFLLKEIWMLQSRFAGYASVGIIHK